MFKDKLTLLDLNLNQVDLFHFTLNFIGNEKKYLKECINSTYVSSSGKFVDRFEMMMGDISQTKIAVAVVNGTSALQVALRLAGVKYNDEVITQSLTFVATANAIKYNGAHQYFLMLI